MLIDSVNVIIENGAFSVEDAQTYISLIKRTKKHLTLKKVVFSRNDTFLDIRYSFREIPFERIRRIALTDKQMKRVVNN